MLIKCWGTRGSIPVSGRQYIKYGGSTTCFEINTKDGELIIIDAGSGIRELGIKVAENNHSKINLLLTHAHWDHIMGFPFFRPIYTPGTNIAVFGCSFTNNSIKEVLANTMTKPHFPVNFQDIRATFTYNNVCDKIFQIGNITVATIHLSHPNQGLSFKLTEDDKSFVFMTDNELTFRHIGGLDYNDYLEFIKGADILMHDSEYTQSDYTIKKAWGHSVYNDSLRLALESGVKQFGLIHHNQERSDDMIDEIVNDCKQIINEHGSTLDCFAVYEGMEIEL
ncbi:MAG: MBL fold metallo-hydrolase [Candidatus Magnetoovum sp. WYHC-5]|nr:MBL fold metallo-hydrolase [Candidatus Magnetoovum sp. WYHC-5]